MNKPGDKTKCVIISKATGIKFWLFPHTQKKNEHQPECVSMQSPFSWACLELLQWTLAHHRLPNGDERKERGGGRDINIKIGCDHKPETTDALTWTNAEIPVIAFFMPSTDAAWMNLDLTLTSSGHQDISTSLSLFLSFKEAKRMQLYNNSIIESNVNYRYFTGEDLHWNSKSISP